MTPVEVGVGRAVFEGEPGEEHGTATCMILPGDAPANG